MRAHTENQYVNKYLLCIQICRCCDNLFKVFIAKRIGIRLTEFSVVHVAAESQEIRSDTEMQSV